MEVNDLLQSDQGLHVRHGLIDICTKFQVPISFLAATAHNIHSFHGKKVSECPPLLLSDELYFFTFYRPFLKL